MHRHEQIRWFFVLGAYLVLGAYSIASEQWTATTDFSATQNPNGQWSYGWSDDPGVTFQLYEFVGPWEQCAPHGVTQWFEPIAADPAPRVSRNDSCAIFNCGGEGGVDFRPGELVVHPGPGGEHSVIRWTAPVSAEFAIAASFQGRDQDGASTDVHVFHNSVELFSAAVTGTGVPQTYVQLDVALVAGDTIDFTVGDGGNGFLNDIVAVYASVVRTSWNAAMDFSPTTNPSGAWSYGWSNCDCMSLEEYTQSDSWSACPPETIDRWFVPQTAELTPSIAHNPSSTTINCAGGVSILPGEMILTPGQSVNQSAVQWDAPFASYYSIDGAFQGRDQQGATTEVSIRYRMSDFEQELFSSDVIGNGALPFAFPDGGLDRSAAIQFRVGSNGNGFQNDAMALDVRIEVSGGPDCGNDECEIYEAWFSCPQDCSFPGAPVDLIREDIFFLDPFETRFISLDPEESATECMALRVELDYLHRVNPPYSGGPSIPFTAFEGEYRWVGPPQEYVESSTNPATFFAAALQCTPYYNDWSTVGILHVTGSAVVPSSRYLAATVGASCAGHESECDAISLPSSVYTTRWGDVAWPYNPPDLSVQPDVTDISALVNKFRNALGAPGKTRALLAGEPGNPFGEMTPAVIDVDFGFSHISACVDAYRGREYPYTIAPCP